MEQEWAPVLRVLWERVWECVSFCGCVTLITIGAAAAAATKMVSNHQLLLQANINCSSLTQETGLLRLFKSQVAGRRCDAMGSRRTRALFVG